MSSDEDNAAILIAAAGPQSLIKHSVRQQAVCSVAGITTHLLTRVARLQRSWMHHNPPGHHSLGRRMIHHTCLQHHSSDHTLHRQWCWDCTSPLCLPLYAEADSTQTLTCCVQMPSRW